MTTISLSELEADINEYNASAAALKIERDNLVKKIAQAGLGRRFAQKALAAVTIKMPDEK